MASRKSNLELAVWILGLCVAGGAFYSGVPLLKAVLILIAAVVLGLALGATRNKKGLLYQLVNYSALVVFISVCILSVAAMVVPCNLKAVADALGISTSDCRNLTAGEQQVKSLVQMVDSDLLPDFERLDESGNTANVAALHLISAAPALVQQLAGVGDLGLSPGYQIEKRKAQCNAEMMHAGALRFKNAGEFVLQADRSVAVCNDALQHTCGIWNEPTRNEAQDRLKKAIVRDNDCNKIRFFKGIALGMAITEGSSKYSETDLLSTICKIDLEYAESRSIFEKHASIGPAIENYHGGRNMVCAGFFGNCCD